ncbi:hypothetical protein [cf. Phormidesmis sp. LEGE 11477]|uniref:hypothetical protein n=1 Tax=cf. Phormidesmis sp. LEGE 11477 TaxID=1828680 RepID=UPI001882EF9A|nr:hypothetical protein [cf. Phormidesmis sp. LEGE 11477]MBE9060020.1 hypothetical protein [cf. Phormidesmis sp. LEGE 11477]
MSLPAVAHKAFTLGISISTPVNVLWATVGVSIGAASWLSIAPTALAQVNTADYVCYLHGSDGRHYDLSALCGASDTQAGEAEQAALEEAALEPDPETDIDEANGEVTDAAPGIADTDQFSSPLSAEEVLRTIDDATRLLNAPNSTN